MVVSFRPKMRIVCGIDELDIDAHLIARFLDGAFEDIRDAELLRDLRNVIARTLESLCRCARDDLEVTDSREPGQNFLLNAVGEILVGFVLTEIFKRKDGDRFPWQRRGNDLDLLCLLCFGSEAARRLRVSDLVCVKIEQPEHDAMLHFACAEIMQEGTPLRVLLQIVSDALRNEKVTGVTAIHHPLGDVDAGAGDVPLVAQIRDFFYRPAVNSHADTKLWMLP